MVQGGKKGPSYEREICKQLSSWVSAGEKTDIFWRSIGSGSQWTNSRKKNQDAFANQIGDITAISDEGSWLIKHFALELKHYKDLEAENLIFGSKGVLRGFWRVHSKLCESSMKVPLLVARQNYRPDLLLMPANIFYFLTYIQKDQVGQVTIENENLTTCLFEKFLEIIPYRRFHKTLSSSLPSA